MCQMLSFQVRGDECVRIENCLGEEPLLLSLSCCPWMGTHSPLETVFAKARLRIKSGCGLVVVSPVGEEGNRFFH